MFIRTVKVIEVGREGNVIHYRDMTDNHYYLDTTTGQITDGDGVGENVELEVVTDFYNNTAIIATSYPFPVWPEKNGNYPEWPETQKW